jgi:hypothetical protein
MFHRDSMSGFFPFCQSLSAGPEFAHNAAHGINFCTATVQIETLNNKNQK